jgi:DNA repair exonuclease SbcCD ATPase subunit
VRFERVDARAFGPLSDETLEFGPGLTVVWGLNESGKSSWHAALYAALCGVRRGKGRRKAGREFAERHQPWSGDGWKVGAVIVLDDSRRVHLDHDLEGRVECRAVDADTGRDLSGEIMEDGAPDGSRWLGFDRRTFPSIACVRQAELLAILDQPDSLQEYLQRAADTAGIDATAAAALACIEDFRKNNVGPERSNSPRPLQQALDALENARGTLDAARDEHAALLALLRQAEEQEDTAEVLRRQLALRRAGLAKRAAGRLHRRAARAAELATRFPTGAPPPVLEGDALGNDVSAALRIWRERPPLPELVGSTAADIRAEIEALPAAPERDLAVHADVWRTHDEYLRASQAVELHERGRPPGPHESGRHDLTEEELLALARDLETEAPKIDAALLHAYEQAKLQLERAPSPDGRRWLIGAGAVLTVAGLVGFLAGQDAIGLLCLVVGVGAILWAALHNSEVARAEAVERLRDAENAVGAQRHAVEAATAQRRAAAGKAAAKNLAPDPDSLRQLANESAQRRQLQEAQARWTAQERSLKQELSAADANLQHALRARGAKEAESVTAGFDAYQAACAECSRLADEAGRRPGLERQLAAREAAERAAAEAEAAHGRAEAALRDVARRCEVNAADDDSLARGLQDWQQRRSASLKEEERRRSEWAELETLLEGHSLEEVRGTCERQGAEADRLAQGLDAAEVAAAAAQDVDADELRQLEHDATQAQTLASELRGQCEERARSAKSVAEAEEELIAAENELARVRGLQEVLAQTKAFLEKAEHDVHRDVARMLAATIRPWLPSVTNGRYDDVRVDPDTLKVSVREAGGEWRNAALLSHGTAEQIYLLLRVALAKHLAKQEEACPLILDDVTVQCDSERTRAALDLLHQISKERQVILFSQEDEVLAWADARLQGPADVLHRLRRRAS